MQSALKSADADRYGGQSGLHCKFIRVSAFAEELGLRNDGRILIDEETTSESESKSPMMMMAEGLLRIFRDYARAGRV